ncbi:regulator of chromosome condensation 1/beta-lactamase-inhibitor protein II [Apodospora peruviana]|uniref:Regulator of chromosome condensation 1/beta-lactamase-inhibitor protein II n=1 Tax=Apodospora peruviana TaxID=516989 RepID=A0AAE0IC13_9PEZI|nr:regulator of chromosome condensation 1/beta-lactamase-inhibitor protein II [Apodospora peruviana]
MTTVIFALGSNGSGQLGIGHKEDVSVPKMVLFHDDDSNDHDDLAPAKIVAGGNHTIIVTTSGSVYWAGDFTTGACGKVVAQRDVQQPEFYPVNLTASPQPFKVGPVAATWEGTIITRLDDEQNKNTQVYAFGSGNKGELGLGEFIVRTPNPSLIPNFPPPDTHIIDLSACASHVVAVLSNGEAWGWGVGRKGQLGQPAEAIIHSPRKIIDDNINFKVIRAVCGREFTCLFGSPETGDFAIIGSDKRDIKSGAPPSQNVAGWKEVGASWGNVYVLKQDGTLLSWGRNDQGQQLAPADLPRNIERIAVGSEHVVALNESGDVTAWGWGEHGNCGPATANAEKKGEGSGQRNVIASSRFIPPGAKIVTIGAGCATSWVAIKMPPAQEQ